MKKEGTHLDKDVEQNRVRLEEISATPIGTLTEEEVLSLFAERKQLEEEIRAHEEQQQVRVHLQQEQGEIQERIEKLNQAISPDKADDELLKLITERKELEAKLENIERELTSVKIVIAPPKETAVLEEEPEQKSVEVPVTEVVASQPSIEKTIPEVAIEAPEKKEIISETAAPASDEIGRESIIVDPAEEGGILNQYLEQLKGSESSLGIFLQSVPQNIKRSKKFMLEVAKIDPAYAMHYADLLLKQDEDFNMKVANLPNKRNSGNVLAEMLPEARTAKVVIIAVKQDYRNIRFAVANMENYREMIDIAKKGALERVKALKDGADIALLVPKVLQKDPEFMREVESVVAPSGAEEMSGEEAGTKNEK